MRHPAQLWGRLRASFWFTPALLVLASMALAAVLVEVDAGSDAELSSWSPRLFGAGADGSRAMLSAIATSMVTVAGVVFSITIVTLSLTSTQYSPRVLRNFMRDAPTQVVLGVFVGIFAYCLVVLRTIRGGDEDTFIPSVAVMGGMGYAFIGIAVLIFFIHHVAQSIQASFILRRIADDTTAAIDHLFPQELGAPPRQDAGEARLPLSWAPVRAARGGYVTSVDADALLQVAGECRRVLRLQVGVGDAVTQGQVLAEVGGEAPLQEGEEERVRGCVLLGRQRTVEQDAGFGLQQLVDVALRALSPSLNDPTTACMCLHELAGLLARLAGRAMPSPFRFADGVLRVIAPAPEFGRLVHESLAPVVRNSGGDLQVLAAAVRALHAVHAACNSQERRRALLAVAREIQVALARVRPRSRAALLRRETASLQQQLKAAPASPPRDEDSASSPLHAPAARRG